jgi:hypothetical protein
MGVERLSQLNVPVACSKHHLFRLFHDAASQSMQPGQDSDSLLLDGSTNSFGLKVKKTITIHDSMRTWHAHWCYLS